MAKASPGVQSWPLPPGCVDFEKYGMALETIGRCHRNIWISSSSQNLGGAGKTSAPGTSGPRRELQLLPLFNVRAMPLLV